MIELKRVYDKPSREDGYRVLIDRLWPRGLSREAAAVDLWLKDIAPSSELRRWFGHLPERFNEFSCRYTMELNNNPSADTLMHLAAENQSLTLLYSARDPVNNQAVVLKHFVEDRLKSLAGDLHF